MSPKLQCHISETTFGRDVYILKAGNPTGSWTFDIGLCRIFVVENFIFFWLFSDKFRFSEKVSVLLNLS